MLDFTASAQYMIDRHYTQSKYLAANSASAGGIVMGGAMELTSSPPKGRGFLLRLGCESLSRFGGFLLRRAA